MEIDFPSPFLSLPIFGVDHAPRVWAVGSLFAPSPGKTKVIWPVEKIRFANGTLRDFAEYFDEKLHSSPDFDPDAEFAWYVVQLLEPREAEADEMKKVADILSGVRRGKKIEPTTIRAIELRKAGKSHRQIAEILLREEGNQLTGQKWRDKVETTKRKVAGNLEYHRKAGDEVRRTQEYFLDSRNHLLVYRRGERILIVDSPDRRSEK